MLVTTFACGSRAEDCRYLTAGSHHGIPGGRLSAPGRRRRNGWRCARRTWPRRDRNHSFATGRRRLEGIWDGAAEAVPEPVTQFSSSAIPRY